MIVRYVYRDLGIVYEIPDICTIVLRALRRIPPGRVVTYREIGLALGDIIAARAVGYIMATNRRPDLYPCYKVVNSDGRVGGYSLGVETKISLLRREGIRIHQGKIENLEEIAITADSLRIPPVLESLRRIQNYLSYKNAYRPLPSNIRYVASFDLSYVNGPPDIGIGVGCLFDLKKKALIAVSICALPIFMPYIPTYLAFRELPSILLALEMLNRIGTPQILLLDGQGILHPRKFGIATHAGLIVGIPSIGIAKSILVGKISDRWVGKDGIRYAPIEHHGETLGYVVERGKHMIVVSPGSYVSLDDALEFVLSLEWKEHYPEPTVMFAPHRIATMFRKHMRRLMRQQTTLTSYLRG